MGQETQKKNTCYTRKLQYSCVGTNGKFKRKRYKTKRWFHVMDFKMKHLTFYVDFISKWLWIAAKDVKLVLLRWNTRVSPFRKNFRGAQTIQICLSQNKLADKEVSDKERALNQTAAKRPGVRIYQSVSTQKHVHLLVLSLVDFHPGLICLQTFPSLENKASWVKWLQVKVSFVSTQTWGAANIYVTFSSSCLRWLMDWTPRPQQPHLNRWLKMNKSLFSCK